MQGYLRQIGKYAFHPISTVVVQELRGCNVSPLTLAAGIKFDRLKQPRWVPIESNLGCHLGLQPFVGDEAEILYRMFVE